MSITNDLRLFIVRGWREDLGHFRNDSYAQFDEITGRLLQSLSLFLIITFAAACEPFVKNYFLDYGAIN